MANQKESERIFEIAYILAGNVPLAWHLHEDGQMKLIDHDGRSIWFTAEEVEAAGEKIVKPKPRRRRAKQIVKSNGNKQIKKDAK